MKNEKLSKNWFDVSQYSLVLLMVIISITGVYCELLDQNDLQNENELEILWFIIEAIWFGSIFCSIYIHIMPIAHFRHWNIQFKRTISNLSFVFFYFVFVLVSVVLKPNSRILLSASASEYNWSRMARKSPLSYHVTAAWITSKKTMKFWSPVSVVKVMPSVIFPEFDSR